MNELLGAKGGFFRYRGSSMWPYFQPGDLLVVETVPCKRLRRGDCIVFRKTGASEHIVHRIMKISPCIRTRGDGRGTDDDSPVLPAWIEGRVKARQRHGSMKRVSGGLEGVMAGWFYRYAGRLDPSRKAKGGKLAGLMLRILRPVFRPWVRRARMEDATSEQGRISLYIKVGNRVVAVYDIKKEDWSFMWPYSLLTPYLRNSCL